jgi:tetratricopeptide (TPR) repeat protein
VQLIAQAQALEQSGDLQAAERIYRQAIAHAPADAAGYVGFVHALAKQHPGRSFVDIYRDEVHLLEDAHRAGIWLPEIVLPLASLYWEYLGERERGIQLVEHYLRQETDIVRVREVLFCVTDELFSGMPPDHEGIIRVHGTFQRASPIALTPDDRLYPFLKGAPGDLQDSFFALGRVDEWFATVDGLWRAIRGSARAELRSAYLYRLADGCRKAGRHDRAIATGRQYLRHLRTALSEPFRSSQLAQRYATLMAPSYLALGQTTQVARAFQQARHHLSRYSQYLRDNPAMATGWTMDQFVEPFVNVGTGALLIGRDAEALALFQRAESAYPGHLVVQFQLAGLSLQVERDRDRAISYLRRAWDLASARGGTGSELVRSWFRSSRLFAGVQRDAAFLEVFGRQ